MSADLFTAADNDSTAASDRCPWLLTRCIGWVYWHDEQVGRCWVCGGECVRCTSGHVHAGDDDLEDCVVAQ